MAHIVSSKKNCKYFTQFSFALVLGYTSNLFKKDSMILFTTKEEKYLEK